MFFVWNIPLIDQRKFSFLRQSHRQMNTTCHASIGLAFSPLFSGYQLGEMCNIKIQWHHTDKRDCINSIESLVWLRNCRNRRDSDNPDFESFESLMALNKVSCVSLMLVNLICMASASDITSREFGWTEAIGFVLEATGPCWGRWTVTSLLGARCVVASFTAVVATGQLDVWQ